MTVKLNSTALTHARDLVKKGAVVRDERDDWSEHAPSASDENAFLDGHPVGEFAKWYLGIDTDKTEGTKGRYSFPFGDFESVHRCGVLAAESRAAQNDHDDIATAAKNLLSLIDA